jgi:hypothetical protein
MGPLEPDPNRRQTLAGFPQTVHPQVTLTVPEMSERAMVLRCFEMLYGSHVDFPQQLLLHHGDRKCFDSFRPWR